MADSILAFQATWLAQFWNPSALEGDFAFVTDEFQTFLRDRGIGLRPVPPRRYHKNPLEPKHGVIRSIYLRLKHASPDTDPKVLAHQAVIVSNDLYGSDTVSAFELAKGFTKPVDSSVPPFVLRQDLLDANESFMNKRRLNLILRSNVVSPPPIKIGDTVQVY